MKLTKGENLSPSTKADVLRRYVYRLTTENGYPHRNPCGATVPAISDQQWINDHAFYVRNDGKLAENRHQAMPAYLA